MTPPRIDVIGLIGAQITVVRQARGRRFSLRFLDAGEVRSRAVLAPVAVLCSRFVSHSAHDRARAAGARLVYANGAAGSVIAALDDLLGEGSVILRDAGTGMHA